MQKLTPEAELAFTRGMLHLRRGEQAMPTAMSAREDKVPPGTDVLLSLVSLAAVATSRALGQTRWIEEYREEMRQALVHFDKVAELAPEFPEVHFRRAQALRYLGENNAAREAVRRATELEPDSEEYAGFLRVLEGSAAVRRPVGAGDGGPLSRGNRNLPEASRGLTWDDIILPARTKRELRQMQAMLENPTAARSLGVEPPTGLLLYGPSGTGKTTIARILAAQAKCRFFSSTPAEINSMWMGESEKAVARLFSDARAAAPSIIFLDEIDALAPTRSGGVNQYSDKVVNQFLLEMDGLQSSQGVFVVGATNRPDMLDAALLRGGRLSRQIEIPLPNEEARFAILLLHTRDAKLDPSADLGQLAKDTTGFSGADLRALVNEAGLQALIRLTDDPAAVRSLTPPDFALALENMAPGDGG
jgi:transitional endoplasmic reticulum ATPase